MVALQAHDSGMHAPRGLKGLAGLGLKALAGRLRGRLARLAVRPAAFRVQGLALPLHRVGPSCAGHAREMYRGRFSFAGVSVECAGQVIFDHRPGNDAWLAALHGFDWLHELVTPKRQLWRIFARSLIADWDSRRGSLPRRALAVDVMARRVINWIAAAPGLLQDAPEDFARIFFHSLTWQVRKLARRNWRNASDRERILVRLALAHAAFGLRGLEHTREAALARLGAELERQILPDGGHISRSPAILLDIVALLMPLRDSLRAERLAIPAELGNALERALPMLRFFRHGDGGLALFNGVSDPMPGLLSAVLEADPTAGKPLGHAPHSGYGRMAHGEGLLIADVGKPPAPGLNADAALSSGAMEFSHGPMRIITNCGAPRIPSPAWRAAARLSRAHSMALPGGQEAGRIVDNRLTQLLFKGPALIGPARIQASLRETRQGSLLEMAHDAFVRCCGLMHRRRLFLSPDGQDLRGEDSFIPEEGREAENTRMPFSLRFHLHPSVDASLSRDGRFVILRLADKSCWRFSARGGALLLEESVLLASEKGLRRSRQIVVEGTADGGETTVKWALRRMEEAPRRKKRAGKEACPQLPL